MPPILRDGLLWLPEEERYSRDPIRRRAKKNGIDCAGVLFGYGSREELEEAGADFVADSVEAVRNIILLDTAMN